MIACCNNKIVARIAAVLPFLAATLVTGKQKFCQFTSILKKKQREILKHETRRKNDAAWIIPDSVNIMRT